MSGRFLIIYGDEFLSYHFGDDHPLQQLRVKLAFDLMHQTGVAEAAGVVTEKPNPANTDDLLLFHAPDYIEFVRAACEANAGWLDRGDTPARSGCFDAALYVVGASMKAVQEVWSGSLDHAFNLGGGLHHAHRQRASGFCLFNDVAISISYLLRYLGVKRVAYIDIDAHQGDGVMYGFYNDPRVLNIDLHEDGRYLFPGTGRLDELGEGDAVNLKVNIPFPPYTADSSFIYAFREIVPPLIHRFRPEIMLVQTGVDSHHSDPLTHMRLSCNSYVELMRTIHNLAHQVCAGKLVLFGGGGYNPAGVAIMWTLMAATVADVQLGERLPERWRQQLRDATGVPSPLTFAEEHTDDGCFDEVVDSVLWLRNKLSII